jgi:hypothetical protein
MARTIKAIQDEIIAAKDAQAGLSGLTSGSATAIWRLWTYIIATAIYSMELLWDLHKAEVADMIATQKPHTLRWYQQKALDFQYGSALPNGQDTYDNSLLTPDQVAAQQIVVAAAAVESPTALLIKVVRENAGELTAVTNDQYNAIESYFQEIKDAGIALQLISTDPDKLKLDLEMLYDPQVLDDTGARLDGTNSNPVKDAVNAYLRALEFNGRFVLAHLIDAMQAVEGIHIPTVLSCQAARFDNPSFTNVNVSYDPYSGAMRIYDYDVDVTVTWIADV